MKSLLLPITFIALGFASQTQAEQVDVVNTWSLNTPTLDCFRPFDEYRHKKTGWTYYDGNIFCVTGSAFIKYKRRVHDSAMS